MVVPLKESESTGDLGEVLWFGAVRSKGKVWFPSHAAGEEAAVLMLGLSRGW